MADTLATLPNLEAFVATVEAGSFTAAARRLGVTPQATSRAVLRLEAALGVALVRRTTRTMAVTAAGHAYYQACVASLDLLRRAEGELRADGGRTTGTLRLSAPTSYGHAVLPTLLAEFRARYPDVGIALSLTNRNVDFARDDVDLAIRMGDLADFAGLRRVTLGRFPVGCYASPGYLARRGVPRAVDDLAAHQTIGFVMPRSNRVLPWRLHVGGQVREHRPGASLLVADDVNGLISLAVAGLGLIQAYQFMAEPWVARGALREVLPELAGEARAFSLVHPGGVRLGRPARAFVDWIRTRRAG